MIEKVLSLVRGLVRPVATIFLVAVLSLMAYKMSVQFVTRDIALMVIGAFTGAVIQSLGYWFGERKK